MLTTKDVDEAASAVAQRRENWDLLSVAGGPPVWTIDYETPDDVVTIKIQCQPGTTKGVARQLIEKQLQSQVAPVGQR